MLSNSYQKLLVGGFSYLVGGNPVENFINCGKKPFLNIFKCFNSID